MVKRSIAKIGACGSSPKAVTAKIIATDDSNLLHQRAAAHAML
jgi:hypothetical protein